MSQQECVEVRNSLDETQPEEFEEFTEQERERLGRFKRAVARGERSDHYPVDKRQDFIRWLITQGKLSEN